MLDSGIYAHLKNPLYVAFQVRDNIRSLLLTGDMKESTRKMFLYKAALFLSNLIEERESNIRNFDYESNFIPTSKHAHCVLSITVVIIAHYCVL